MGASVSDRIGSPITIILFLLFMYMFGEASAGSHVSTDNLAHLFLGTYACLSLQAEHLPSIARSHSPLQPKAQCSRRVTASDVSGIVDGDHVLWHIITIKVLR